MQKGPERTRREPRGVRKGTQGRTSVGEATFRAILSHQRGRTDRVSAFRERASTKQNRPIRSRCSYAPDKINVRSMIGAK